MEFENIIKMYEETYHKISSSSKEWENFLRCACRNYKLRFDEQVLLYAQAPNATAVLEASRWSRSFGRLVKSSAKSIFVFESAERKTQRMVSYFDVSDTTATEISRPVPIWEIGKNDIDVMQKKLAAEYKLKESNLNDLLKSVTLSIYSSCISDNVDDIIQTNDLIENMVTQSAAFMMASRLNINDYPVDFSSIQGTNSDEFETMALLTLTVAKTGISDIAKIANDISIERSTEYGYTNKENRQHNIPERGRVLGSEPISSTTTGGLGTEFLRNTKTSISGEASNIDIPQIINKSENGRTFERDSGASRSDGGTSDRTDGTEGRFDKRVQERKSAGMGTENDINQNASEGDSSKRVDLRLEYFDVKSYTSTANKYISDDTVRKIFLTTPFLLESLSDIEQLYLAVDNNDDRAVYIESVFNADATHITLDNGEAAGYKKYENVLHVWLGTEDNKTAEEIIEWKQVAKYFEAMRLMGELTDMIKPIASPDEQLNMVDELKAEINPSAFVFKQNLIDEALKSGSGFKDGKMRIFEQCEKNDSVSELAEFLKKEYGTGGGSSVVQYTGVGDNHDSKGLELYSRYYDTKIQMNWNQVARHIVRLYKEDKYLSPKEKEYYPVYLQNNIEEKRRWEIFKEFRSIISDYNNFQEQLGNYEDKLNTYFLVDMASNLGMGNKKTYVHSSEGTYILPALREAMNKIIAENTYLTDRCKNMLDLLNSGIVSKLEPSAEELKPKPKVEKEYKYHLGDKVYIGNTQYEIMSFDKNKVELFNADYPLIPEEMERDVFDKRVRENFRNEHLLVEVAEPKYDDAFFIKDNGNITWIYYNPDSDAGGQYVTNNFTVEDINEASSKFNEPEAFFDYIGMVSKQNLSDVGTEWFTEAETQFLQIPDFTNLTLDTMNGLVEYSLKEQSHSIAEKLVEAVQDIDYYEYLDNLDSGETEEDVIKNIAERITDENYAEGVIDYLQKAEDEELLKIEQSDALLKVEKHRPEIVTDKFQNTPISERHNFNLLINEIKEVGKKERYRRNIDAITVLKQCEKENRFATPEEQKVLSNYVGWGGIPEAFDENNGTWAEEYRELKALLSNDEYSAARESTLTAFYTPLTIIESIYDALENLGFKTGNILEPSCGIGHFIGMLPDTMKESKVYGVELDNISASIAQQLYQTSRIAASGYENTNLPDNFFDVVVGNVPFGDFKVIDKKYDKHNFLIHDYFFAKSLDKLRPGGVMALITSKGTMDKQNPAVRKYISERAELLGAIRLPNNTFKGNAGTEVVSDILFLKKKERLTISDAEWIHTEIDENNIEMNSYFVSHPEMILGTMTAKTGRFGLEYTCEPIPGAELKAQLQRAISNIKGEISAYEITDELIHSDDSIPADPSVRNFSYTIQDGKLYYRSDSIMTPANVSKANENRIKGMIKIRDSLRALIEAQKENYTDAEIEDCQKELNRVYDEYVSKYGHLSERANVTAFKEDSSAPLLASLENIKDGNFESKADIFTKRTIKPHKIVDIVDTAQEALVLSLSEKACVDMEYMAEKSGKTEEEIFAELKGAIFLNPRYGIAASETKYLPADEYLSGNVREKLALAQKLQDVMPEFKDNVEALEKVQPTDLSASEISVRLGAIWISPEIVSDFTFELLNTSFYYRRNIEIEFSKYSGEWHITNKNYDKYNLNVTQTYGTNRANAYSIIEDTLNLRDVRVYDYIDQENGTRKPVLNKKETAIAQSKQELIKQAFQDWIWQDPQRREELTRLYNDKYNAIRPREYDGSHITFSGINSEIELRPHQKNAIAHILYGGNTLLAHAVGAGKTFEMVAAAMESKRLGLCTKSLFVVPNHLTEQWASEFLTLYPAANILVAKKRDFEPKNRKRFVSKIATGDYDAIIIGHSQFEKIPMSIERQIATLEAQRDEIIEGITELKSSRGDKFTVKAMEKAKKQVESKLAKLNQQSNKDNVVTFEELGVDRIFVDEAHYYKNLYLYTKMRNVGGIAQTEAMKSSDLYMKCRYLDEITEGRGVVFATGTPISNSMVELYTMQRYLQHNTLVKNGLQHFDAWASTFGETVAAIELTPEGTGYRSKTRFARFYNLPELMSMFKEVADIQTSDMLDLPVPKANYHHIAVKPSAEQKAMVEALAERAERIRAGVVHSSEDNMLIVTNDGRNLALDQRIVNPMLPDFEGSKVNACVENMYQIWLDGKDQKTTQLFFCDLSTPKNDGTFSVYNDIKAKLVAKGIPETEIRFIHDADTEAKKLDIFNKTRSGDVRILMGSTQKMGAGTNVQDKLVALHDLDCPWRPADLEQRLGRIVRQGNRNEEVHIYRYVTEQTFDAYLYQLVEGKQKFASQIMTSKTPVRSCEDIDETALSYAEIKMLATGNPQIKEKMDLDIQVQKLRLLKSNYLSEKYALEDRLLKFYPNEINKHQNLIARMETDLDIAKANPKSQGNAFVGIEIMGKYITEKEEAGKAILQACKNSEFSHIGRYRGFEMYLDYNPYEKTVDMKLKNQLSHFVTLGTDVYGNITRIDNALDGIESKLNDARLKLDNIFNQYENAKRDINKPFVYEDELATKTARLNVLNALLNVDKTENEIVSEDASEDETVEESISQVPAQEQGVGMSM